MSEYQENDSTTLTIDVQLSSLGLNPRRETEFVDVVNRFYAAVGESEKTIYPNTPETIEEAFDDNNSAWDLMRAASAGHFDPSDAWLVYADGKIRTAQTALELTDTKAIAARLEKEPALAAELGLKVTPKEFKRHFEAENFFGNDLLTEEADRALTDTRCVHTDDLLKAPIVARLTTGPYEILLLGSEKDTENVQYLVGVPGEDTSYRVKVSPLAELEKTAKAQFDDFRQDETFALKSSSVADFFEHREQSIPNSVLVSCSNTTAVISRVVPQLWTDPLTGIAADCGLTVKDIALGAKETYREDFDLNDPMQVAVGVHKAGAKAVTAAVNQALQKENPQYLGGPLLAADTDSVVKYPDSDRLFVKPVSKAAAETLKTVRERIYDVGAPKLSMSSGLLMAVATMSCRAETEERGMAAPEHAMSAGRGGRV